MLKRLVFYLRPFKEIKKYYDLDNFFKAKINNYTKQASIYTLFELSSNPKSKLTSLVEQKSKIVSNYLLSTPLDKSKPSNIFEQFKTYDKDLRLLSYKTAVDSFNTKYSSLNLEQKQLLSVYINEVSNTPKLKNYINECVIDLKSKLNKYKTIVKDPAISIKLDEMVNILKPIKKSPKDEDVNNLLKYYSLVTELKNIHG
jgi:F0F1-type ATP synthase delta subunit